MNFEFTPDQTALLDAIDKLAARYRGFALPAAASSQRFQYEAGLQRELAEAGFFEVLCIDELGPVAAAAMVMALAQWPGCVEVAASALVAPALWPADTAPLPAGPFAVVQPGAETLPLRYLPVARTLVRLGADSVDTATLAPGDVHTIDSLFAYPVGVLHGSAALPWAPAPQADAPRLQRLWQVAIAAELVGCLSAGLQAVLAHVRERRQFGRPLGSFQAVQHRLAHAHVLVEGARWLVLRAADSGTDVDAGLALGQAQRISTGICHDLHQFMGAMGLTLEHPLHRWTYRARLLRSELGGADRRFAATARTAWGVDNIATITTNTTTNTEQETA